MKALTEHRFRCRQGARLNVGGYSPEASGSTILVIDVGTIIKWETLGLRGTIVGFRECETEHFF